MLSQTSPSLYVSAVQVLIMKTLWDTAGNEQFLLFPQCSPHFWKPFQHFHQIQNCHLRTLSVSKSLKFNVWERVNYLLVEKFLGLSKSEAFIRQQIKDC